MIFDGPGSIRDDTARNLFPYGKARFSGLTEHQKGPRQGPSSAWHGAISGARQAPTRKPGVWKFGEGGLAADLAKRTIKGLSDAMYS